MVRGLLPQTERPMTPEPPVEAFHDLLRGMAALSGNRIVADVARLYGKGAPRPGRKMGHVTEVKPR